MVVFNDPVDQQGVGCTARHAVEVTSDEHGDVCAGCYLLQALEKCVHLCSIGFLSGIALWLGQYFSLAVFHHIQLHLHLSCMPTNILRDRSAIFCCVEQFVIMCLVNRLQTLLQKTT